MDYAAWKLFLEATELGSLTRVALARGTTQPQISRQIAELERVCGGRLYQRTGRGVRLTQFGERILPHIKAWVVYTEQLQQDIQALVGKPLGTVRLGIAPSIAHPFVSTLYQALASSHPQVQLQVREGTAQQLDHGLEDGSLDLALIYRHTGGMRHSDIGLLETATYLAGAPGSALLAGSTVPFNHLHQMPLVLFSRTTPWREHLEQLCQQHGVGLRVMVEADSLTLQTRMIESGGMYAVLGPFALAEPVRQGRLRAARIIGVPLQRPVVMAMSKHGEITPACRSVMQMVQSIALAGPSAWGLPAELQSPG